MSLRSRQFRRDRIGWLVASCILMVGLSMGLVRGFGKVTDPTAGSPSDGSENRKPTLDTISWLCGHWQRESGAGLIEELWMPARGGLMLGLHRSLKNKKAAARFEYLRIEDREDGIFLIASADGEDPIAFRLSEADYDHAVFQNPENDFPKRIEYQRRGTTRLVAMIWGDEEGPAWNFVRSGDIE